MFKIKNYLTLFILLIIAFFVLYFNSFKVISTNIESILPNSEKKELLKKFNEFQISKKLFLYVDKLDTNSLLKIKKLEKELLSISSLSLDGYKKNQTLENYQNEFKFYLLDVNKNKIENLNIKQELQNLKNNLLNSQFLYTIDKYDPLELFKKDDQLQKFFIKNGHLAIEDKGYISIFSIDKNVNNFDKYEEFYKKVSALIENDDDVKVFSSIFYFVENSQIIKNDVNKIIYISTVLLIILYILILRNIKLLFNTLITLGSSILIALFISSLIFDEISIFVLVFGISISSIAIDYMFHHYVHKEYENGFIFDKDVFLGMFTTVGSFFIISFIEFDLIKQLCYFTIISLLFSYIQFAFLYPIIGFKYTQTKFFRFKKLTIIPTYFIIFLSIIFIIFSIYKFNFDSNLKNLDVENKKLDTLFNFFSQSLTSNQTVTYLIKANSIDELISNSKEIKTLIKDANAPLASLINQKEFLEKTNFLEKIKLQDIKYTLENEAENIGFKKSFFEYSYLIKEKIPIYSLEYLQSLGFEILKFNDYYISYINIPKDQNNLAKNFSFIENLNIKYMFENKLLEIENSLFVYGFITILFIISVILLTYKKNILVYFCFILFPFASILSISLFTSINILHIFMLFIILSISIDYGIYISSYKKDLNTDKAIIYSILTTFAGFGVLIFSNINALFSIGIASTVGILGILFLLIFLKGSLNETKNS